MRRERTVLSAGYMPLDIIEDRAGVRQRAGGTAANVAAILGVLGWRSRMAGRVGDDPAGQALLADLRRASVDCSSIRVEPGALTNRLIHRVRPRVHRYLYACPECGQSLPRSRPLKLEQAESLADAGPTPSVFFFDRANAATVYLAERYASAGTTVVFEPSTPASAELVQRAMSAASIVKGSDEHGPELVEYSESGRRDQLRIVTEGAGGARFRAGSQKWRRVGVFPVDVVDAAGAGDWTTAGMLHRLSRSQAPSLSDVAAAIEYGHALAALNCQLPGARALAEGRGRASIAAMVGNLRRGRTVRVESRLKEAHVAASSRHCAWCLLEAEQPRRALPLTAS